MPEVNTIKFKVTPKANGSVNITWDADGRTNYRVQYIRKLSDDPAKDRINPVTLGVWYSETREGQYTLTRLVPGVSYWIGVFDEKGNGEYRAYEPRTKVRDFMAFEAEVVLEPSFKVGDSRTLVNAFTQEDIADDSLNCGMRVGISYNNQNDEVECLYQMVLEDPNGSIRALTGAPATVQAWSESMLGWDFYELGEYFDLMEQYYGSVPAGTYKLSIYLDSRLVGTKHFQVSSEKASADGLRLNGLKYNTNGTVTITWKDNGKGPFRVSYLDCWSGDIEADKKDKRTSAYWKAADNLTDTTCTLEYLVPGKAYWIVVTDSAGNSSNVICNTPSYGTASMNMQVNLIPRMKKNGEDTDYGAFSAKALNASHTEDYGLNLHLKYSAIAVDTKRQCQFVLTLPNDVYFCLSAFEVNLFKDGNTYWDFYDLDWAFEKVKDWYGQVLQGEYKLDVYLEGKLAGSSTFRVTASGEKVSTGITIQGVTRLEDGGALIRWSDSRNKGPYRIEYALKTGHDFMKDKQEQTHSIVFWDVMDAAGPTHTLEYLTPGQPYWIIVYNNEGKYEYIAYDPGPVEIFPEFGAEITARTRTRLNGEITNVNAFSAAEIAQGGKEFGARVEVAYPKLARERLYDVRISITAPNGSVVTNSVNDQKLERGGASKFYWVFYDFSWYFDLLMDNYGRIPVGEYTLNLYFNRYFVDSTTFKVDE